MKMQDHDPDHDRGALVGMRQRVIKRMRAHGAYLFASAVTGSQYVKFKDPRVGSLRISDHKGRDRYRYKWNLLRGGDRITWRDGNVKREGYGFHQFEQFLLDFEMAANELERLQGVYDPAQDPYREQRITHRSQLKRKRDGGT